MLVSRVASARLHVLDFTHAQLQLTVVLLELAAAPWAKISQHASYMQLLSGIEQPYLVIQ
ncbi:hypothetical protein HNQ53_001696 [Microbulbifer hydrolyticus]|uniref:Uncharacterized protein n=1 Tax=Microbulbifer hydrolyticus TaxID=48074 RepID=A0AA89TGZ4_9GAMM|nr:hypothetical protein [Microbulbifer hydrolyticus]